MRRTIPIALALILAVSVAPTAVATSDAGDAGYSFNESRGCGNGTNGPRTPYLTGGGLRSSSELLYGPWADFFGRDRAQIDASLVSWAVPGSGAAIKMHERVLPALNKVVEGLAFNAALGLEYSISSQFGWAFRSIGGSTRASQHLFGNAVDFNPPANPHRADNTLITDMPDWFRQAFIDAGFCWGGQWVELKDTMHYSWMGPVATPGYGPRPAPYPPLTAASGFNNNVLAVETAFSGAGTHVLSDRSGDGSEDLYFISDHEGTLRVEVAGSRFGFGIVGIRRDTSIAADASNVMMGDLDHDSRADLWVRSDDGSTLTVYSDESDFTDVIGTFTPAGITDMELALGHYDSDFILDLFAIGRGPTTSITVLSGASAYQATVAAGVASIGDTTSGWSFAVGDYDVDGVDDVYAIQHNTLATVRVLQGNAGFAITATIPSGITGAEGIRILVADYDGDGRDDLFSHAGSQMRVYLGGARAAEEDLTRWFLPSQPWPWDAGPTCVGPLTCDQIGFADSDASWSLLDRVAAEEDDIEFLYGNEGDVAFSGDWDCDGVNTPGLYRRADGYVYLRNSNSTGIADINYFFGDAGDLPLAGDFNGNGCDTVSLYRPTEGRFYVINRLGSGDSGLGAADANFLFGDLGDKPFVGDFDGNGVDDVGLHREATGLVYYRFSLTQGNADHSFLFGDPDDVLVSGDWDGTGADTVAVYRPSDGNWYVKLENAQGVADHAVHYSGDGAIQPVAGYFGTASRP
ncbi:MAG: M15 family metallopeptidase [Acidimicrobiia bacterium]|nr:M15 family metallopeptidase [Acidimicrobiia bacterium]MDH3470642.1 M15 family metallopeptidase [Acidimicrobiia bacterium]